MLFLTRCDLIYSQPGMASCLCTTLPFIRTCRLCEGNAKCSGEPERTDSSLIASFNFLSGLQSIQGAVTSLPPL